jgi:hypothetical protein
MLNALGDEERTFTVSLGKLQRHDGLHQPLLRSVVKVAHDPPARSSAASTMRAP